MKKQTLKTIVLLVIPLLVVAIASTPGSVTVWDGETSQSLTFMQNVPESNTGWCAPIALLLTYVVFGLAVLYGLRKKLWALKGIYGVSFAALVLAALPTVVRTEILVVPNVGVALLLGVETGLAYLMLKNPEKAEEPEKKNKNKRLKAR